MEARHGGVGPGVYTPTARVDCEADTVKEGVRENTPRMGTFGFEREGKSYDLVIIGKDTASGVQPVAHVKDRNSYPIT